MGQRQYKRVYRIIYGKQDSGLVEFPFTLDNIDGENLRVQFRFSRTNNAEPDRGFITIYNLPKHIRKALKTDLESQRNERLQIQRTFIRDDVERAKRLLVNADEYRVNIFTGYGGEENLELLFRGDLINVTEMRRGRNEIATQIELGDTLLALRDSYVNQAFGPNSEVLGMFKQIIDHIGLGFDKSSERFLEASIVANAVITHTDDGMYVVGRAPETIDAFIDLFGAQWWVKDGVLQVVPQGLVIGDFSIRLKEGEDLMSYTEESVGDTVKGRALLNAHIHPGRGLILEDEGGERHDAQGYRVNQATSIGDTEGLPWYTDFEASGVNTVLIPQGLDVFGEAKGLDSTLSDFDRRRGKAAELSVDDQLAALEAGSP